MPDYMSPELVAACHRAEALAKAGHKPVTYRLRYRVGSKWYSKGGFDSEDAAQRYRSLHTDAHLWDITEE